MLTREVDDLSSIESEQVMMAENPSCGILGVDEEGWNVVGACDGQEEIFVTEQVEKQVDDDDDDDLGLILSIPSAEDLPSLNGSLEGLVEPTTQGQEPKALSGTPSEVDVKAPAVELTGHVMIKRRHFVLLLLAVTVVLLPSVTTIFLLRERRQVLLSRDDLIRELESLKETAEKAKKEFEERHNDQISWDRTSCKDNQTLLMKLGSSVLWGNSSSWRNKVDLLGKSLWSVTTAEMKKIKRDTQARISNGTFASELAKIKRDVQSAPLLDKVFWNLTFEVQKAKKEVQHLKKQMQQLSNEMKASSFIDTVDRLGLALWNVTVAEVAKPRKFVKTEYTRPSFDKIGLSFWNISSNQMKKVHNFTKKEMNYFSLRSTMDKIGHSLWNYTGREIRWDKKNATKSDLNTSSFLDRVERFGQSFWRATTGVGRWNGSETGGELKNSTSSSFWKKFSFAKPPPSAGADDDYDIFDSAFYGMYGVLSAASTLSIAMSESVIAATRESVMVMDFNRSLNYIMEVTKYAVEEASLSHAMDV